MFSVPKQKPRFARRNGYCENRILVISIGHLNTWTSESVSKPHVVQKMEVLLN
jgi:hypothetical protein